MRNEICGQAIVGSPVAPETLLMRLPKSIFSEPSLVYSEPCKAKDRPCRGSSSREPCLVFSAMDITGMNVEAQLEVPKTRSERFCRRNVTLQRS